MSYIASQPRNPARAGKDPFPRFFRAREFFCCFCCVECSYVVRPSSLSPQLSRLVNETCRRRGRRKRHPRRASPPPVDSLSPQVSNNTLISVQVALAEQKPDSPAAVEAPRRFISAENRRQLAFYIHFVSN